MLLDNTKVSINVQPATHVPQQEKDPHFGLNILNSSFKYSVCF